MTRRDDTTNPLARALRGVVDRLRGPDARTGVVLILGMHRSGTSALTRVLSLCGGDLPATLCPAVAGDNDLGYWESEPLIALHERLFREIGTFMLDPDPIDPAWFRSSDAERASRRLRALLEREFTGKRCWLVKEPRMCRFMPLWRKTFADAPHRLCAVLPVRDPAEVAASLAKRDGMPAARAARAWIQHVAGAERHTRDLPRCFTAFDGLMTDWRATAHRVARIVPGGAIDVQADPAAVEDFLRPSLRHHRAGATPLAAAFGGDAARPNARNEALADSMHASVHALRRAFLEAAATNIAPEAALVDRAWIELEERRTGWR